MEEALTRLVQTAKESGCPEDQIRRFITKGYAPYPWQLLFHASAREADKQGGPVDIGVGGARGPGKSHAVLSQAGLDDCQRVERLKGLFLRQTGIAAKESFDDLIDKVLLGRTEFKRTGNQIIFPNGSKIVLGGFKDERDIDKYVGIEYDFIIIEEENQLTKEKVEKLRGSLRTSKPNWRPRLYGSFNPGGVGHGYIKERYITPHRENAETETRFIPSTYKDNPNLNIEYVEYLESLTGDLGKAWREGDFDLFAGQYFTEWRQGIHVCEPFEIPEDWRKFCGLDYGYNAPASLGWYAIDPEGTLFRYREHYITGRTGKQLAEDYVSMTGINEKIEYIVCDPSFWAKRGESDDALSTAEKFETRVQELLKETPRHCPALIRGNNDRITGWRVAHEWLTPMEREGKITSKFKVFSTCKEFIRTIPTLIHDPNNPEDVDTDGEDHCVDDWRYSIMSRPKPTLTQDQLNSRRFQMAMKRKKQLQGRI